MNSSVDVYDQKLSRAAELLGQHNSRVPEDQKLNWDTIKAKIFGLGATSDDTLKEMSWEDLESCGVPRLLARQIANQVFRPVASTSDKPQGFKASHVKNMTKLQLFQNYDITGNTNSLITERLIEVASGKRCVVVDDSNNVLAELSAQLLQELLPPHNFPEKPSYSADGKIYRVLRVGEMPNLVFDENPLYPGERLRNSRCDNTNRDWTGVPLQVRQLVYLAVESGDIKINSVDDAHRIMDLVVADDAFSKLQSRYPNAAIQLQELAGTGDAPTLKIAAGGLSLPGKPPVANDPFYSKHRRT